MAHRERCIQHLFLQGLNHTSFCKCAIYVLGVDGYSTERGLKIRQSLSHCRYSISFALMEKALAKDFSTGRFLWNGESTRPLFAAFSLSPFPHPPFACRPAFLSPLCWATHADGSKWAAGAFTAEESPKLKKSMPSTLMSVHNLPGWE